MILCTCALLMILAGLKHRRHRIKQAEDTARYELWFTFHFEYSYSVLSSAFSGRLSYSLQGPITPIVYKTVLGTLDRKLKIGIL